MAVITQTAPGQLLRGTTGNDTFYVNYLPVYIQDYLPTTDVLISSVSIDLALPGGGGGGYGGIEGVMESVSLSGVADLTLGGHSDSWDTPQTLAGNSGNNTIDARGGDDTIYGLEGNDSLVGQGFGNKFFDGGPGNDTMKGSEGNDTYIVDSVGDVIVDPGGIDWVYYPASLAGSITQHSFIENWVPVGGSTPQVCGQYICASILPGQVYSAVRGVMFSQQLLYEGTGSISFHPPPQWHVNQMPEWMSLSQNGVVSGVPTESVQNRVIAISINGPNNQGLATFTLNVSETTTPTVNVTPSSLSEFSTNAGSPSSPKNFSFSGTQLTSSLTVSCTQGFEISINGTSYSQQIISQPNANGGVSGNWRVRISPTATSVGALSGAITFSSPGAGNAQINLSGEVLPAVTRPVTFSVNLNTRIAFGQFSKATDSVQVRGQFNDWTGFPLTDPDGDGIYSGTFTLSGAQGLIQNYKFFISSQNLWESIPDRSFTMGPTNTAQILDTVYFNNQDTLPGLLLGDSAPTNYYLGGTLVNRIHVGEDQVFP